MRDPWNSQLGIADKKPNRHLEEDLQKAVWEHIKLSKAKNVMAFSVPNGMHSSKRMGARFKAQGMLPGVADLTFVLPDGSAAFLELKIPGGVLSPAQKVFEAQCLSMGVPYFVCYSIDSALAWLRARGIIVSH